MGGVAFLRWPMKSERNSDALTPSLSRSEGERVPGGRVRGQFTAKRIKVAVIAILLAAALAGFFVKYRNYFSRGATSVVARFDYWKAAWQIIKDKPVFGSGPGTFGVVYKRLKDPKSEMSKLVHNDYLQQGSDAGVVALLAYTALILGSLSALYRRCREDLLEFGVWLGLLGIALQGLVEFGLFIPALAWPQFLLLGWLWGGAERAGSVSG